MKRWNAVIAGDWKKAYGYHSPGSRELQSYEIFKSHMQMSPARIIGAEIADIACHDGVCDVRVNVEHVYRGMVEAMRGQVTSSPAKEKWLLSDGVWWYVTPVAR